MNASSNSDFSSSLVAIWIRLQVGIGWPLGLDFAALRDADGLAALSGEQTYAIMGEGFVCSIGRRK